MVKQFRQETRLVYNVHTEFESGFRDENILIGQTQNFAGYLKPMMKMLLKLT